MRYKIADIITDMNVRFPRLKVQGEAYIYNGDAPTNITIDIPDEFLDERLKENPHLDYDTIEYLWMGAEYYNALVHFNGMMLHSSCVVYNNRAYLFSAPCGTGKSTHTQLWLKRFPGAYILNDDKPALRVTKKGVYAYGTPFSGKTGLNINTAVPVGGICIISRDTTNHIERVSNEEALFGILNQTVRPYHEDAMDKLLTVIDAVLKSVPVYSLSCNMDLEAAEVAYNGMNENKEEIENEN